MKRDQLTILIGLLSLQTAFAEPLFSQGGTDPSFQQVLHSGKLPAGHPSKTGVTGSKIHVQRQLVELTPESRRPIAREIKIHTLANGAVPRQDFAKWSRWYQEDGSTEVFRLFEGERNVHNARENAARIEAFSAQGWKRGAWHEWSGSYTIVKPHGAAIFQVKNDVNDWAVQLNMNGNGDVILNHRRAKDAVIATNMTGKPFLIRIRDNGQDYEVFLNGGKVGGGSYARPRGTTHFRWGMYVGNNTMKHDAMIFVSGATVRHDAGA
jgi:hypothetical protein